MKWFKHFSDALGDPFIQELMDEFSHSGYVAWFGLLEVIANENGNLLTGELRIKPIYLKRKLRISLTKLEKIFNFCATYVEEKSKKSDGKPKLIFDNSKETWYFYCSKILELRDNYTKDLQVASKKPSSHKEVEAEKEIEAEKEKRLKLKRKKEREFREKAFEVWWPTYPKRKGKRVGKQEAKEQFVKIIPDQYDDLNKATGNYSTEEYPKDACRFLKKDYWKDWINIDLPDNQKKTTDNYPAESGTEQKAREAEEDKKFLLMSAKQRVNFIARGNILSALKQLKSVLLPEDLEKLNERLLEVARNNNNLETCSLLSSQIINEYYE